MEDFEDIVSVLDRTASSLDLDNIHWINGEPGPNWCFPCGKAMAKHLRRRVARKDKAKYILDGGYDAGPEEDGCATCEGCGKLLNYCLTRWGVIEELRHFLSVEFDDESEMTPEAAYELREIFTCGKHYDDLQSDLQILADKLRLSLELN